MLTPALLNHSGSYRGRFAPSPSGPLHFGSLVAALASFLDAKANQGSWLVRIEDIDTPRVVKGADSDILSTLEAYGLYWDEKVIYQSQRHDFYANTLDTIAKKYSALYPCICSRKDIKSRGGIYNNHCRYSKHSQIGNAIRVCQNTPIYDFIDRIQGKVDIPKQIAEEDYIVKRRDGLYAYQLVVVADDIAQSITHIVRGADLLEATARQLSLFKLLSYSLPSFAHVPVVSTAPGLKLSKQNHAPGLDKKNPKKTLIAAMRLLGLAVTDELKLHSVEEILTWAISHYKINAIPSTREILI
jgi:glutamyl-Q tRNA(Asp) synthetase